MVGRSQENFRVRRPPGRQSGRPRGGRDHEGMCWGAFAEKRTNAIEPVERTVRQQQPRAYRGRRREPRTDGTVDLSLWCRSEGKGSGGKARGIQPRALRLGHWSALRSVPTVALSSVQSNPILTSKMHRARRPRKKNRREALDIKYSFRDGCLASSFCFLLFASSLVSCFLLPGFRHR